MALDVSSVWTGATTATTARVKARLTVAGSGTLLVADNEAMTGPASFGPVASGADNVIVWDVSGLSPNSRYWLIVNDGAPNPSWKATFRTHPGPVGEPASYMFGAAGDAGLSGDGDEGTVTNGVSNGIVFDTMRAQGAAEEWTWFSHLGDLHYKNIATNTVASYRSAYVETMNYGLFVGPQRQSNFLRSVASTYVWDDHDFGPNNSDRTAAGRPAAQQAYREWVPHYPLPDTAGIYQSWQVGRVLYIASDVRSFRDPNADPLTPAKTMLGSAQKTWMENLLTTTSAEALVWQSPSRWVGGSDTWDSFAYERAEMVQMFGDTGWLDRMIFMTADMHAVSMCSGPNNPNGGFPMFMFAGMDAGAWSTGPEYDIGSVAGRRQYGTMRVQDDGHTIALTGTGYHDGTILMAHTAYVDVGSPLIALDYQGGHVSPPFEPDPDDQGVANDVTATRQDGGEARFVKTEGLLNVGDPATDPDAVGVYDGGDITVNVAVDEQLGDQAAWRVHLGTVDEERYPLVHIDLAANPDLADEMTGLGLGDRMTVAHPPEWLPPETIELIAEGGTETIGLLDWDIELNASPGTPWTVAQLPAPQRLVHGTFETDLSGWAGSNATALRTAVPAPPPFPGAWSARITPNGSSASGGLNGTTTATGTVTAGENYLVSCWVYSPGGWADLRACVDWYDAAGVFLASGLGSATVVPAGVWTLLAQTLPAPAGASKVSLRARHGGTPSAAALYYVDELQMWETAATGYSAGPDSPNRADTSGSRLVAAVSAPATTLTVHTPPDGIFGRVPWIISSGPAAAPNLQPTHFPLDLRLAGEVVRATACTPAAWDAFTRVTANGWGSANSGQAWTVAAGAAADFSTTGSEARHTLTSVNASRWSTITAPGPDLDFRADFATSALAVGNSQYVHLGARWLDINNCYLARLAFTTTQQVQLTLQRRLAGAQSDLVSLTLPGAHAAAAFWTLRFQLEGTALRAKAWPRALAEPERWHVTTTDASFTAAGSVGVRSILDNANTNPLPVTVSVDTFEITTPQTVTVQRAVNTVDVPHTADTPISLAQPSPLAL